MSNEVRIKATVTGNAKQEIGGIRDAWTKFQREGGQGVKAGLTAATAAKGFTLLDTAISGVVGIAGDAVQAAMEEEDSIARLTTSLQANVKGWNGNTDAIEKVLQARMKLGFSDDEQRESLSLLVAATHDVNKALDIERTAMDLARFKRISLTAASEALVKVEGGQYRALKGLGIVLKEGATQTEALAAVQAVAAGQAEKSAETTSGKLLTAQVEWNEALEHAGTSLLPLVTEGLEDLSRALDPTSVSIEETAAAAARGSQAAAARLGEMQAAMDKIPPHAEAMKDAVKDDFAQIDDSSLPARYALEKVGMSAEDAAKAADDAMKDIVDSVKRAASDLESAGSEAADALYDPMIDKAKLAELEREASELRAARKDKSIKADERAANEKHLAEIYKDQLDINVKLAAAGDKEAAERVKAFVATAKASGKLSAQQIADLNNLLLKLGIVESKVRSLSSLTFQANHSKDDTYHRASGGPMYPGKTYTVGENGPEKVVMGTNGGYVIPNAGKPSMPLAVMGGSGGGPLNVNVMLPSALMTPATIAALGRELGPAIEGYLRGRGLV